MRIIGGKHKRKALSTPAGTAITRPTSDRVKENLFNIIAQELSGALVVDLFSGSGALGLEALSRGAASCIFVERNKEALQCLRKNLDHCKFTDEEYFIAEQNVEEFLEGLSQTKGNFSNLNRLLKKFAASTNIIFADPPYADQWYDKAIDQLDRSHLCGRSTLLILEMAANRESHSQEQSTWLLEDVRKYGQTRLEFWRRRE